MSRHHHYRHRHDHRRSAEGSASRPCKGFVRYTIRGLARKFGVPKGVIIAGFVMLFIMSTPLALAAFFGSWYWLKHPGKLEAMMDRVMDGARSAFAGTVREGAYAPPAPSSVAGVEPDSDFSELRARFADLEARASRMEEHVSSQEYELNKEFKDMRGP